MERVVITGIGMVTPAGNDSASTWDNVVNGKSGIANITTFDTSRHSTKFAGEVKGFEAEKFIPRKKLKEMCRFSHLAVAASTLCMQDAGIELTDEDREQCGTFIGVGLGGLEGIYNTSITLHERGPDKISPYFIPSVIGNLAGGQVAMMFGLRGPSYANTSACASSAHALGEAFEWIRRGRTSLMLAGGAEATVTSLGIAGFSAMFALSRRNAEPEKASRPWDRGRDGFVCAEGAGSLLLESLSHAKARGAKIYAEIVGYGASCDAYHLTKPAPEGEGAQRAMVAALQDARLDPSRIGYVNAHGTSTPHGDIEEAKAMMKVFGERAQRGPAASTDRLWVSSTKSVMGHLLGGAGGVEAALVAKTLHHGIVPPTINLEDQDPECLLDCVPNTARERRIDHAMSNSFGFGGTNATLVFSRFV